VIEQQFLDAVAVAMITPGPAVITVAFIGFLVAGLPGAERGGLTDPVSHVGGGAQRQMQLEPRADGGGHGLSDEPLPVPEHAGRGDRHRRHLARSRRNQTLRSQAISGTTTCS
jgi:hypothetical protein